MKNYFLIIFKIISILILNLNLTCCSNLYIFKLHNSNITDIGNKLYTLIYLFYLIFDFTEVLYKQYSTTNFLLVLSKFIGWVYVIIWAGSFYPQFYETISNKSVEGLSFDFQLTNLYGYVCYSVYNIWCRIDPKMGAYPTIQDIVFSVHGVLATLFNLLLIKIFYNKNDKNQKFAGWAILCLACLTWGFIIIIIIEQILNMYDPTDNTNKIFPFNSIIYLGWSKACISLIKYIPQVVLNCKRKSTYGWSIINVWFDLSGSILSFLQDLINLLNGVKIIDNNNVSLNYVKYAISIIGTVYSLIFIVQHYIMYKNNRFAIYEYNSNSNRLTDNMPGESMITA